VLVVKEWMVEVFWCHRKGSREVGFKKGWRQFLVGLGLRLAWILVGLGWAYKVVVM
jgi:hypothetical protein